MGLADVGEVIGASGAATITFTPQLSSTKHFCIG